MEMMFNYDDGVPDGRTDAATAQLVEQGIAFDKVLGRTVALAFLREQHVAAHVIYRVLGSVAARRDASPPTALP